MEAKTSLLRVEEDGAYYRVLLPCPGRRAEDSAPALEFKLTPEGVLNFDNRQPEARLCARRRSSRLLAEEMIRTAQTRVPGALGGRTHRAVAFELRVHYCAFRLGVLRSHSVTAEIGSLRPHAADYDSNAVWFEHPFRSAPAILKALFKG